MIKRASQITGRNLQQFTELEDIRWALEVHVKNPKFTCRPSDKAAEVKSDIKSVLMTGNEDSPDEIWVSRVKVPKMNTKFELAYSGKEST